MDGNIKIGEDIKLKTGHVEFGAFYVPDSQRKSAIILIHEVWGLNDHIKDVALRFAGQGYAVLAPDLLSQTGIMQKIDQNILAEIANPETRDEAQKKMRAATAPISAPGFADETLKKLQACFDHLLSLGMEKIAVIGFCFGGTYAYAFAVHQPNLAAVVPFYGHAPQDLGDIQKINCPVLAFYGALDTNLVAQLPVLEKAMEQAGKDFVVVVYPDTGHAFFNNTNPRMYNKPAAEDAWARTIEFLDSSFLDVRE